MGFNKPIIIIYRRTEFFAAINFVGRFCGHFQLKVITVPLPGSNNTILNRINHEKYIFVFDKLFFCS
jgi:hypothetical protein